MTLIGFPWAPYIYYINIYDKINSNPYIISIICAYSWILCAAGIWSLSELRRIRWISCTLNCSLICLSAILGPLESLFLFIVILCFNLLGQLGRDLWLKVFLVVDWQNMDLHGIFHSFNLMRNWCFRWRNSQPLAQNTNIISQATTMPQQHLIPYIIGISNIFKLAS